MPALMNIGEAARAAGVSAKMIRHYEQIGLMPAAPRTDAGYRKYTEREVTILRFVRQSRLLGFSIEQIAALLGLWSDDRRASRAVKALAQRHLESLEARMRELEQMQRTLRSLVTSCHGDDAPHCAILEELAVGSAAPLPGSVGTRPAPRRHRPTRVAPGAAADVRPAHADLMAWTHRVRGTSHPSAHR